MRRSSLQYEEAEEGRRHERRNADESDARGKGEIDEVARKSADRGDDILLLSRARLPQFSVRLAYSGSSMRLP